jgi:hypothetical protein
MGGTDPWRLPRCITEIVLWPRGAHFAPKSRRTSTVGKPYSSERVERFNKHSLNQHLFATKGKFFNQSLTLTCGAVQRHGATRNPHLRIRDAGKFDILLFRAKVNV